MKSVKSAGPGGTRQEIEHMIREIQERVLTSPAKAAKILSAWLDQSANGGKKSTPRAEKKRIA